jgi:carbon monoxide dehydrogenase subunit G
MQLDNTFKVPVPVDEAWRVMLDYPRLASCMPGATVDEVHGDDVLGRVKVKLGPVSVTYQGKVTFTEKDEASHRVTLSAAGREMRGSGTASAQVTAVMTDAGGATEVSVTTDLNITGRPAQFGRGVVAEVSERLIGQFADNLARELENGQSQPGPAGQAQAAGQAPLPAAPQSAAPPAAPQPAAAEQSRQAAYPQPSAGEDSLNLLGLVGGPLLKRVAPVLAVAAALTGMALVRRAIKRRSAGGHGLGGRLRA